jgi:hypothetical protein
MSDFSRPLKASSDGGNDALFLVRWRGRQEGPYSTLAIEAKLAANEIGLLHEIYADGKWVSIRDYIAEREEVLRIEAKAREMRERLDREEAESQAREREEQQRAERLAEERRKNDFLAADLVRHNDAKQSSYSPRVALKPHRGGQILSLGIIGLFVCGPLCLAAWIMGGNDLSEMDAGLMDDGGRSTTSSGRNLGILGSLLWLAFTVFYVFLR